MSYVQKVLQPGETVLYNRKLHWIVYMPALAALIVSVLCIVFVRKDNPGDDKMFTLSIGSFLFVVALALFIRAWILRFTTEIVVTDKRVILKRGLFLVTSMEMNMSKVETVDVLQSIIGRMLNYGTVLIRGTGSSYEPLDNVASPIELRNAVGAK